MTTATETYRYSRLRVQHFNVDVPTVIAGRSIYFPLRSLCEVLGLAAPHMQIKRLKGDARYADALRELPVPTTKGLRTTWCIRKQMVGVWLSRVDVARVTITAKGPLEEFQRLLFAAAERFLFGDLSDAIADAPDRPTKPVIGVLHLGDCPRCGLSLCLTTDETGAHLVPEPGGEEG